MRLLWPASLVQLCVPARGARRVLPPGALPGIERQTPAPGCPLGFPCCPGRNARPPS